MTGSEYPIQTAHRPDGKENEYNEEDTTETKDIDGTHPMAGWHQNWKTVCL